MLSNAIFDRGIAQLAETFRADMSPGLMETYREVIRAELTDEQFEGGVKSLLQTHPYGFPSPAQVLEACRKIAPRQQGAFTEADFGPGFTRPLIFDCGAPRPETGMQPSKRPDKPRTPKMDQIEIIEGLLREHRYPEAWRVNDAMQRAHGADKTIDFKIAHCLGMKRFWDRADLVGIAQATNEWDEAANAQRAMQDRHAAERAHPAPVTTPPPAPAAPAEVEW
jgi:hypothetical protein